VTQRVDIEIIDQALADYAGQPAWEGTAWRKTGAPPATDPAATVFVQSLPARYRRYTLENLTVHDGNARAVEQANTLQLGQNLFLHGSAGNGKTHLAVATARRLAEAGHRARFWGVVDLFNQIRNSFNGGAERPDLLQPAVLVLDDLGKIKPTEFVFQELYGALEARWAHELTTICTANHGPEGAAKSLGADAEGTGAILSRLASGRVAKITGKDLRVLGGKAA